MPITFRYHNKRKWSSQEEFTIAKLLHIVRNVNHSKVEICGGLYDGQRIKNIRAFLASMFYEEINVGPFDWGGPRNKDRDFYFSLRRK